MQERIVKTNRFWHRTTVKSLLRRRPLRNDPGGAHEACVHQARAAPDYSVNAQWPEAGKVSMANFFVPNLLDGGSGRPSSDRSVWIVFFICLLVSVIGVAISFWVFGASITRLGDDWLEALGRAG